MLDFTGSFRYAARVSLVFTAAMMLSAQSSGRSYGPDRIWWDAGRDGLLPWEESYDNPDGLLSVISATGALRTANHPFFEPLGRNGRACVTCHQPSNAMSVSVVTLLQRWEETHGKDPVFAAIDGSNCPDLPQDARASHSLILKRGLFRIALPWPPLTATPEFRIEVVRDPTGCNLSTAYGLHSPNPAISVYRRPRVAANLKYAVSSMTLMADGREPSLRSQAISAILTHEQSDAHPTLDQLKQIVEFESQIFVAQSADIRGGLLNEPGGPAALGPQNLAAGKAVRLDSSASFEGWRKGKDEGNVGFQREFRASVARGSDVFFSRGFQADGVQSTCATCHAAGITRWMDIGTANRPEANASPELPLFRITCDASATPHPSLGRVIYTQDPGRALISGKCADVGAIVMQQFRGLAARAPYFSSGSAASLSSVVEFYDRRFGIHYTREEKQDLVNFLTVL